MLVIEVLSEVPISATKVRIICGCVKNAFLQKLHKLRIKYLVVSREVRTEGECGFFPTKMLGFTGRNRHVWYYLIAEGLMIGIKTAKQYWLVLAPLGDLKSFFFRSVLCKSRCLTDLVITNTAQLSNFSIRFSASLKIRSEER